jgi:DNA-binding MarR family transcriptional regulator
MRRGNVALTEDVIEKFGFVMLGSRLKRLGERLQSDTQRLFEETGLTILPAQFVFLAAVDRLGPVAIGELAQALGVAQPGVTRTVAQLAETGLLEVRQPDEDQRRRVVALSQEGRRLVALAKRELWPRVEAAVRDLCGDLAGPLLEQLATMEARLAEKPLGRRAPARGKEA